MPLDLHLVPLPPAAHGALSLCLAAAVLLGLARRAPRWLLPSPLLGALGLRALVGPTGEVWLGGVVALRLDTLGLIPWAAVTLSLWWGLRAGAISARWAWRAAAVAAWVALAASPAMAAAGALGVLGLSACPVCGRRGCAAAAALCVGAAAFAALPPRLWAQGAVLGLSALALAVAAMSARGPAAAARLVAGAFGTLRLSAACPDAWRLAAPWLALAAPGLIALAVVLRLRAGSAAVAAGLVVCALALLGLQGPALGVDAATWAVGGAALAVAGERLAGGRWAAFLKAAAVGAPGGAAFTGLLHTGQISVATGGGWGAVAAILTAATLAVALVLELRRPAPPPGRGSWLALAALLMGVAPALGGVGREDAARAASAAERRRLPPDDRAGWRMISRIRRVDRDAGP